MHWLLGICRRKWQPTPVFLPGESCGRRTLVGCRLWVAQSQTRLKQLSIARGICVFEAPLAPCSGLWSLSLSTTCWGTPVCPLYPGPGQEADEWATGCSRELGMSVERADSTSCGQSLEMNFTCHHIKGKNTFSLYPWFWHQMCGFSHTMRFSNSWWRLTEFPTTSLNSDINCPTLAHTPQVNGSVPQACIHSDATRKSQAINWASPPLPPQAQWFARMVHRPQESTLLTVTDLLWGILNDTHEQPAQETHGARAGRLLRRSSCPSGVWGAPPQRHDVFLFTRLEGFWALQLGLWSLHDLLRWLLWSPAPLSCLWGEGGS